VVTLFLCSFSLIVISRTLITPLLTPFTSRFFFRVQTDGLLCAVSFFPFLSPCSRLPLVRPLPRVRSPSPGQFPPPSGTLFTFLFPVIQFAFVACLFFFPSSLFPNLCFSSVRSCVFPPPVAGLSAHVIPQNAKTFYALPDP